MGRLTLRSRLMLLVLAGVLPLLAVNLAGVYATYRKDRSQATQQALNLAHGLALAIEGELQSRIAVLEVLAQSRELAAGDLESFRTQAEVVVARQAPGANILLLRADGQQLMNTAVPAGVPLPVRQSLDNQRRVLATGQPSVSDVYFGLVVQRPVIAIEVPVRAAGDNPGLVLSMNPDLDSFNTVIVRQQPAPGWITAVVDRAGVRLARTPDPGRFVGQPVTPELLRVWEEPGEERVLEAISPDGEPVITAFSRLPTFRWGVVVAVPAAALTGPAWQAAITSLLIGLLLLLLGLALAHWIARGVLRPVLAVLRLAVAPDGGTAADRAEAARLPEAWRLAEAHQAETGRRRAAADALADSERRLRLVVAELNHRAKNALATVQGLALQTARGQAGAEPARFMEVFTGRLQSLARAHDLLTAFAWEGVALDAILRTGLATWLEADKGEAEPRVRVRCACHRPIALAAPGQAQALIMALHELAVNATKHGALSVPEGRVEVRCSPGPDGVSGLVEWRETGGPPVPARPERGGFGTRLLERSLARDLGPGAEVALDFDPAGLRATICFTPRALPAGAPDPG